MCTPATRQGGCAARPRRLRMVQRTIESTPPDRDTQARTAQPAPALPWWRCMNAATACDRGSRRRRDSSAAKAACSRISSPCTHCLPCSSCRRLSVALRKRTSSATWLSSVRERSSTWDGEGSVESQAHIEMTSPFPSIQNTPAPAPHAGAPGWRYAAAGRAQTRAPGPTGAASTPPAATGAAPPPAPWRPRPSAQSEPRVCGGRCGGRTGPGRR
jgi:hypothetical protein